VWVKYAILSTGFLKTVTLTKITLTIDKGTKFLAQKGEEQDLNYLNS